MESERTLVQESQPRREPAVGQGPPHRLTRPDPAAEPTAPAAARRAAKTELVLGRYELRERLGSGGFGVVWRAHDELLGREVAVKRIWLGPDGDRERATREAQASARLSHPAIVALYEACVLDDAFYLISELVEGHTLARLIADERLEDEEVLEIGLALAGGLAHAHARGVIHRDIKPHNVLVPDAPQEGDEVAKLADFGGASIVGEDALTRTGDVLGTLAYMAPEQSEGDVVGAEADLYALALVLYEALSGVNPVRGPTPAATARRIGRQLQPLARARRGLPRALTDALDGALAPAPEDRGSLEHLSSVLEETLQDGLARPRRRSSPPASREPRSSPLTPHTARTREAPLAPRRAFARSRLPAPAALPAEAPLAQQQAQGVPVAPESPPERAQRLGLPRAVWILCALALFAWQAAAGRPGLGLLALAALAPLAVLPAEPRSSRVGAAWLVCVLAPALGLAGLGAAFPAIAGQGSRWRERLVHGALGYWWLVLAGPLLARRLWLGAPASSPASWEGSLSAAASQAIAPQLSLGVLLGALLWGCGATLLPWIVRGRSAVLDVIGAILWTGALAAATPVLVAGLAAHAGHPQPRGLVLGAVLAAMIAVAARALRGPV